MIHTLRVDTADLACEDFFRFDAEFLHLVSLDGLLMTVFVVDCDSLVLVVSSCV